MPPPPPPGPAPKPQKVRPRLSSAAESGAEQQEVEELPPLPLRPPQQITLPELGDRPLRIRLLSDTHIEFPGAPQLVGPGGDAEAPEGADVLVLAGDIGLPQKDHYKAFVLQQSARFPLVIVVLGNHEFYGGEYEAIQELAAGICASAPRRNVHLLSPGAVEVNGRFWIGGCTLWSEVPPEYRQMVECSLTDYSAISWRRQGQQRARLSARDTTAWHRREADWLRRGVAQAAEAGRSVVIVTHHAPLTKGTSKPHHDGSPISTAFATGLDRTGLVQEPVRLWMFGHTHYSSDQTVNGVRVVSNQVGYVHERDPRYRRDLLLEVPPP